MYHDKKTNGKGVDTDATRDAAKNFKDGAVTVGYQADRKEVIAMLNNALATDIGFRI